MEMETKQTLQPKSEHRKHTSTHEDDEKRIKVQIRNAKAHIIEADGPVGEVEDDCVVLLVDVRHDLRLARVLELAGALCQSGERRGIERTESERYHTNIGGYTHNERKLDKRQRFTAKKQTTGDSNSSPNKARAAKRADTHHSSA